MATPTSFNAGIEALKRQAKILRLAEALLRHLEPLGIKGISYDPEAGNLTYTVRLPLQTYGFGASLAEAYNNAIDSYYGKASK